MPRHEELLQEFQLFAQSAASVETLMERMCQRLHHELARYNWVGFYLLDPKDHRYLPGTDMVKSEIVTPVFVKSKFAAELDIESYFANTFGPADQQFVEACAALVGKYMDGAGSKP